MRLDAHARLLPWLNICFTAVYQFGLMCMYIVSMHVVEASLLIQYERYESSIRLLMTGVMLVYGLCAARAVSARYPRGRWAACLAAVVLCVGCVAAGRPSVEALRPVDQSDSLRVRLESVLAECPRAAKSALSPGHRVADLRADAHYCARYLLGSPNVRTANVYEGAYDEAWYESAWQDYDYLIVLDHYPAVDAFVQAHFRTRRTGRSSLCRSNEEMKNERGGHWPASCRLMCCWPCGPDFRYRALPSASSPGCSRRQVPRSGVRIETGPPASRRTR